NPTQIKRQTQQATNRQNQATFEPHLLDRPAYCLHVGRDGIQNQTKRTDQTGGYADGFRLEISLCPRRWSAAATGRLRVFHLPLCPGARLSPVLALDPPPRLVVRHQAAA